MTVGVTYLIDLRQGPDRFALAGLSEIPDGSTLVLWVRHQPDKRSVWEIREHASRLGRVNLWGDIPSVLAAWASELAA